MQDYSQGHRANGMPQSLYQDRLQLLLLLHCQTWVNGVCTHRQQVHQILLQRHQLLQVNGTELDRFRDLNPRLLRSPKDLLGLKSGVVRRTCLLFLVRLDYIRKETPVHLPFQPETCQEPNANRSPPRLGHLRLTLIS